MVRGEKPSPAARRVRGSGVTLAEHGLAAGAGEVQHTLGGFQGGLAHRLLFRWFAVADRAALLKWKQILRAGDYTEKEKAFLRRYRFFRALWIFNRKRPAARGGRN